MSVFGKNYSRYYNLFYKDKNYKREYEYINEIIIKYCKNECKTVLDIGCGTGKHLKYFKEEGYEVSGIDLSESMISEAKKHLSQKNDLICCKASDFDLHKKYDVIISLFHVMSYQTKNQEIEKVFKNVYKHLKKGGIFIFDFWYGPAVLTDPPVLKIKRFEDEEIEITRIAEPTVYPNKNIVDVNLEVLIMDKKTKILKKINEKHNMRYLFLPEINMYSVNTGLKVINAFEWMKYCELSLKSWYGLLVLSR